MNTPNDNPNTPPTAESSRMKKLVLPLLFILVGVGIFAALRATRPRPQNKPITETPLIVDTQKAIAEDTPIVVETQGTTIAAQKVELRSEVTGRIIWKSEALLPGGRAQLGTALARLDGRDYEIAVRQQEATLGRARLDLQVESGRKKVAEREWAMLKKQKSGANTLALREPQYAAAQMGLDAAQSGLQKAQLNLDRTTIRAPFNGFVKEQHADVGQLITPQMALGSFVGSDKFWVQVKVPAHKLPWIVFPKDGQPGSTAHVWQQIGDQRVQRKGQVLQLAGALDPGGRMAQILVEVEDPLGLKQSESNQLPMLLGSFVNIDIQGKVMTNAVQVPRRAVQEGSKVLIMNADDRLEIRDVQIQWRSKESVYVSHGIKTGDRIIMSRIHRPIGGTLLQAMESTSPKQAAKTTEATKKSGDSK